MPRKQIYSKFVLALCAAAFGLSVAACNTVQGAGEDVKSVGQGMKNASENVQDKM